MISQRTYLFAADGDSGSWVITSEGNVIGMVVGVSNDSGEKVAYITPIDDVLDDIFEKSGRKFKIGMVPT